MKNLIDFVKQKVKSKTGIDIETEIEIINEKKVIILGGGISKERPIS